MEIKDFALTPFLTNCYVVKDGGEAVIIDPGDATESLKRAVSDVQVKMVINTHCHCDHCGGNAEMVRFTGAPLACHEAELPLLRALEEQGSMFGVPFPASPDPARFLEEGDEITVGSVTLKVLFTPGHSPGHISLATDGVVFDGDVLFAGSIGRTDLWGGDYGTLLHSIRTRLLSLPDDTAVYSGHGPATTIGRERHSNPFLIGG